MFGEKESIDRMQRRRKEKYTMPRYHSDSVRNGDMMTMSIPQKMLMIQPTMTTAVSIWMRAAATLSQNTQQTPRSEISSLRAPHSTANAEMKTFGPSLCGSGTSPVGAACIAALALLLLLAPSLVTLEGFNGGGGEPGCQLRLVSREGGEAKVGSCPAHQQMLWLLAELPTSSRDDGQRAAG
ncbi:hypothetical protein EYF80_051179 [Liparis tanakae]|uniref:Uncharacterized protein n=1 Tax=Liparis tanakae TaxID=230148 RepID=A0A4Z2FE30_9TELE|nr:hypothetical protein EYF80_051179 [Liparis tanakae]